MSELYERISKEVGITRSKKERKAALAEALRIETRSKEEALLAKSGIRSIFEELRDKGLVRGSSKPVYDDQGQMVSEYTPAGILSSADGHESYMGAFISLGFDSSPNSSSSVCFMVREGKLFLDKGHYSSKQVKMRNLDRVIIEAVKNPVIHDYQDRN